MSKMKTISTLSFLKALLLSNKDLYQQCAVTKGILKQFQLYLL